MKKISRFDIHDYMIKWCYVLHIYDLYFFLEEYEDEDEDDDEWGVFVFGSSGRRGSFFRLWAIAYEEYLKAIG